MQSLINKIYKINDPIGLLQIEAIVLLLVSSLFLAGWNLFFGEISIKPIQFMLMSWTLFRLVFILPTFFDTDKINSLRYSGITLLVLILCLFGYFQINAPILILWVVGLVDILLIIYLNHKKNIVGKNLIFPLLVTLLMLLQISAAGIQTPWFHQFAEMGIGYIDTFRDAAILQSWNKYSAFTHGTHGLIYTPYHSLFVLIMNPFMSFFEGNAFVLLEHFTFIFYPLFFYVFTRLILYGVLDKKYRNLVFLLFIMTLSAFYYTASQRSTLIACLLTFSLLPIIKTVWKKQSLNRFELFVLGVGMLMMTFARAFHSLVFLSLFTPLIFTLKSWFQKTAVAVISLLSLLLLVWLYSEGKRNSGLNFEAFFYMWSNSFNFLVISGVPLAFLSMYLISQVRNDVFFADKYRVNIERTQIPIYIMLLSILGSSLATLKSTNNTDVFYTSILFTWSCFFIIWEVDHFKKLISNIKLSEKMITLALISLFLVGNTRNILRMKSIFNRDVSKISRFSKYKDKKCPRRSLIDPFCRDRYKILKKSNIKMLRDNSKLSLLTKKIQKIIPSDRKTGLYFHPKHGYWKSFLASQYTGIFMMASHHIPLIYGLRSPHKGYGYAYIESIKGRVTLVKDGNMENELCSKAPEVSLDDVIIIHPDNSVELLNCKKKTS